MRAGDEAVGGCVSTPLCSGMGRRALTGRQRQPFECLGFLLKLLTPGYVLIVVATCPAASCGTVYVTLTTCLYDSPATGRPESVSPGVHSRRSPCSPVCFFLNGALGQAGPRWAALCRPCVRGQPVAAHGVGTGPSGLALLACPVPPQGRLRAETPSARG